MINLRRKGMRFETLARQYLGERGLVCLQQNYQCRHGEIDLICRDRGTLCFVEVKFRKTLAFGGAAYSISAAKQARLIKTAQHYLLSRGASDHAARFDALLIQRMPDGDTRIEWIRNAFEAA